TRAGGSAILNRANIGGITLRRQHRVHSLSLPRLRSGFCRDNFLDRLIKNLTFYENLPFFA
ncbi:hypothetical protein, partial [Phyllobacterium sp.]|uniref:hypothetical protein n=1 Tax=Phyllobacterium sp. TaxID=1871046 RepID=UPI0030F4AF83